MPFDNSELKMKNDLYISIILFDRTGKYTKLKEKSIKEFDEDEIIYNYANKLEDVNKLIKRLKIS